MLQVKRVSQKLFVVRFYKHLLHFFDSVWRLIVGHVGLVSALGLAKIVVSSGFGHLGQFVAVKGS